MEEEGPGPVRGDTSIRSEYCGDLLVVQFKLSRERSPYHVSISLGKGCLVRRAVDKGTSKFRPPSGAASLSSVKGSTLGLQALAYCQYFSDPKPRTPEDRISLVA